MAIPVRILRAFVEQRANLKANWRPAQWAMEAKILQLGLAILAHQGRHATRAGALAAAIGVAASTLRRYYCDVDALMGEILRRHLATLAETLNAIPATTPNHHAARRQAWHAATRTPSGAFTEAHLLFLRDRHMLPADILPELEQSYQSLGTLLAGPHGANALAILDLPPTTADRIEPLLAILTTPEQATPQQANPRQATPEQTTTQPATAQPATTTPQPARPFTLQPQTPARPAASQRTLAHAPLPMPPPAWPTTVVPTKPWQTPATALRATG